MMIRFFTVYTVFALLLAALTAAHAEETPVIWGTPSEKGIVIAAQLADPAAQLHAGGPVSIALRIKNTGTSPVITSLIKTFPEMTSCILFDAQGKPLTPKAAYPDAPAFVGGIMTLQPNEEQQLTIDLSKMYDLSKPGSYAFVWIRYEQLMEFLAVSSSGYMPYSQRVTMFTGISSNLLPFTIAEQ